jgi:hypothetical protein
MALHNDGTNTGLIPMEGIAMNKSCKQLVARKCADNAGATERRDHPLLVVEPVAPATPLNSARSPRCRRASLLMLGLLAAAASVGAAATPASAYVSTTWSGRTGSWNWGYTGGAVRVRASYQFDTPVMIIYHNGATPVNQQQHVTVRQDLQMSNGAVVGSLTQGRLIGTGSDGVAFTYQTTLTPRTYTPGWYRVVTTIWWNGVSNVPYGSSAVTGTQQFVPNVAGDMVCAQTRCSAAAGWVYVSG